jgi:hypothetical protein
MKSSPMSAQKGPNNIAQGKSTRVLRAPTPPWVYVPKIPSAEQYALQCFRPIEAEMLSVSTYTLLNAQILVWK